jgi:hypothetical protein
MKLHRRAPGAAVPVGDAAPPMRERTSRRIVARLAMALAAGSAALLVTPVVAHAATPVAPNATPVIPYYVYQVANKTRIGEYSTSWTTCLHVAKSPLVTHPSCSYSVSVSTHVEASGGVSGDILSSGFGFGVVVTYTYGYGISVDVPANTAGNIQAGVYYYKWSGLLQRKLCYTVIGCPASWTNVGNVAVEQAIAPSMRFVKTAS